MDLRYRPYCYSRHGLLDVATEVAKAVVDLQGEVVRMICSVARHADPSERWWSSTDSCQESLRILRVENSMDEKHKEEHSAPEIN